MTGVKEQTSADYARFLAKAGSMCQPSMPAIKEKVQANHVVPKTLISGPSISRSLSSFLSTLQGKVDRDRIGVLGICASGGYRPYAAQSDSRIKALAIVSAACLGRMTRRRGLHEEHNKDDPQAIANALKAAGGWRDQEALGPHHEAPKMFSTEIAHIPEGADSFFKDATAYYGSNRGHRERSDQKVAPMSYNLMLSYNSFNFQHLISPRALLMIGGTEAQTLYYSKTAIADAREPKELFTIEGKNHFDLYDDLVKSGPKLVKFFAKYL